MITFDRVCKSYPDGTAAVDELTLEAPTGKLTILVGPSGCGKSTSLRMVNRLIEPTSGEIRLNGEPTSKMDAALLRRRIGYVIQHAGLFPHRTVIDNIATTPRLSGMSAHNSRTIAAELIERVGLPQAFAKRYPWQLSGGQQQRVGVARALAADPEFMLMDEPFSAIDPVVRSQLQDEFLRLQRELGKTIIMVTHDIEEALKLGDQVAVMREGGQLVQVAPPSELLTNPADQFVADFVGRDRGYRSLGFKLIGPIELTVEETYRIGDDVSVGRRVTPTGPWSLVVDHARRPLGWVNIEDLRGPIKESDLNLSGTSAKASSSVRHLLDAALSSPNGRGVVIDDDGVFTGTASASQIIALIDNDTNAHTGGPL